MPCLLSKPKAKPFKQWGQRFKKGARGFTQLLSSILTCMCSHVGLQGLFPREIATANFASDASRSCRSFYDEGSNTVIARSTPPKGSFWLQVWGARGFAATAVSWTNITFPCSSPCIQHHIPQWSVCRCHIQLLRYKLMPLRRLEVGISLHFCRVRSVHVLSKHKRPFPPKQIYALHFARQAGYAMNFDLNKILNDKIADFSKFLRPANL